MASREDRMQRPLEVLLHNLPASPALEADIRDRARKLEHFYPHLTGCRVTVESAGKHKHQGRRYGVRIDIDVPGTVIVADRSEHEDVYVAVRDGFDAARRQLEDYARRQRGDTKAHAPEAAGRVARLFDEGYGFIQATDGRELYFSRDNVVSPDFDHLEIGTPVQFLAEMGDEGWQAKRVSAA
jgi:ribosome-associated translation inhibitor RaiA/cold shock CspA family protein